jgi:dTDP-4-dehydrorhamnose reductase
MKVLLLGAGGQVGRAIQQQCPAEHCVISRTHSDVDITNPNVLQKLLEGHALDWVVNAAAYTAVDLAEVEQDAARLVNDTAVAALSKATVAVGCRLLHFSTDFVFDGATGTPYKPDSQTNPLCVYGRTKLAGEHHVRHQTHDGIVLRTAWIYAARGQNFLRAMLRLMQDRDEIKVVRDQIGTPTAATSAAVAAWSLMTGNAPGGIYHWTDDGVASWYDFAVAIQEEALERGLLLREIPIQPISARDYAARAIRPAFSVLNTDSTRQIAALPPRHWRHSLRAVLNEL